MAKNQKIKFNNRRLYEVKNPSEDFPPYLVPTDTGEEIVMLPESDRYRGIPATAYDLTNQVKDGIALEQCPTYIALAGVHGADVATRLANALQTSVENARIDEVRRQNLVTLSSPVTIPAAASAVE